VYAIYPNDGSSFNTITGTTKTLSKNDLTPKAEIYAVTKPTYINQENGKLIAISQVSVTNPLPGGAYSLNVGKPTKNNTGCSFLPEQRIVKRVQPENVSNNTLIIDATWTLGEGVYCLGVEKETLIFTPVFITAFEHLETFIVGGKIIAPSATDTRGCVSNGTDEYCALAPPPGIGTVDEAGNYTGKISLTECYVDGVKIEGDGFGCYLNNMLRLIMGIIIILSVVFLIIAGLESLTSMSGEKKTSWKGRAQGAVLGLIIALSSYLILNTISPTLVNLGVSLPTIELDENPDGPSSTTQVTSSLDGSQVTAIDALCSQVNGTVPVRITEGASAVPKNFNMPIKTGYPWPSDEGKQVTVKATELGFLDPKFEGVLLTILPGNERTRLENAGVQIKRPEVVNAGSKGTTSVYGLPEIAIEGLIRLKKECNCEVIVTGGTECWAHKTHGPGLQPVDLRKTPSLNAFIYNANNTKKNKKDYIWGSVKIYDEDTAHFHVRSW
jgi:hypothetical protein